MSDQTELTYMQRQVLIKTAEVLSTVHKVFPLDPLLWMPSVGHAASSPVRPGSIHRIEVQVWPLSRKERPIVVINQFRSRFKPFDPVRAKEMLEVSWIEFVIGRSVDETIDYFVQDYDESGNGVSQLLVNDAYLEYVNS